MSCGGSRTFPGRVGSVEHGHHVVVVDGAATYAVPDMDASSAACWIRLKRQSDNMWFVRFLGSAQTVAHQHDVAAGAHFQGSVTNGGLAPQGGQAELRVPSPIDIERGREVLLPERQHL